MIEKLDKDCGKLQKKINELVDAVNELQLAKDVMFNRIDMLNNAICDIRNRITALDDLTYHEAEPEPAENVQDKFAEQRKWIGKLCRFWNKTEYTDDLYGFLTDIVPTNKYKPEDNYFVPFKDEFGSFYEHCEPVKPDDDIIYKGGDNE